MNVERPLLQRMIGAVLLVISALLIASVLFDADGRIPEKITNIPPQPKRFDANLVPALPVLSASQPASSTNVDAQPELATNDADADVIDNAVIDNKPETVITQSSVEIPTEAITATQSRPMWSVQVGSFRDIEKASAFRDRLSEGGFNVYVRDKSLSDGSLFTQVFVGPVVDKDQAEALKVDIKSQFNEQGLVVNYRE